MSAGSRALDDEAIDLAVGFSEQRRGERIGSDDGEEFRTLQGREITLHEIARIEMNSGVVGFRRTGNRERVGGRFVIHVAVQHTGNAHGNPRAHDDVIHSGEHGAVDLRKMGNLDLLQIIDADGIRVSFAGEEDLHEVRHHAELFQFAMIVFAMHGELAVGIGWCFAAGDVAGPPRALSHRGKREMIECTAYVTARVAFLQSPREDLIQRRAGYNSQLAETDTAEPAANRRHLRPCRPE